MTRSSLKIGLAALLLVLVSSSPAFAQGGATSSIVGVVEDTQGGVIPGATILATNDATGGKFTAVSGSDGAFTIPALAVGTYTVTISLQGFKNALLKGVAVTAGGPANVRTKLEVGGVTETVTVEAASAMIQTQTSDATTTINTNQITSLPLTSRNALNFVQFLPGVQTQGNVRNSVVAGLPESTINITVDGVNIQDNHNKTTDGFFARMSPRLDAMEQVSLTSAAQGADASGQGAAQIKFTTRSGTNQYQVSLYHFYQSEKLNSNTYSNRVRGLPLGPLTLHQGGGRVGGPVVVPGVYDGRGKAFFFVNYEHLYEPSTITTASTLLLPPAQQGLFRYPGNPNGVNVLALAAQNGFVSSVDPTIAQLLQDIRNSTANAVGVFEEISGSMNTERFRFQQNARQNDKLPTVRFDYNLSDQHKLSFSTNRNHILSEPDTTNTDQATWPGFPNWGEQAGVRYQVTASLRSTLGQNLVNELRVGGSGGPTEFSPRINAGHFTGPLANQAGHLINISNALSLTNAGPSRNRTSREPTTRTFENTLTWLKGAHSISSGLSYTGFGIWLDTGDVVTALNLGVVDPDPTLAIFNNAANFPGSTGTDRANARQLYALLVGSVTQVTGTARLDASSGRYVYNGRSFQEGRLRQFDLFFQDNWRVRPNLSLNLGMRYALQPAFYAINNSYSGATVEDIWGVSGFAPGCGFADPVGTGCNIFKPGNTTGRIPGYTQLNSRQRIHETDYDNWAPSLGVNYTPDFSGVPVFGKVFGAQSESSFSAGWMRAFSRHGMATYTGTLDNNPGLNLNANRTVANNNLGPLPLLLRSGYLGGPPLCSQVNNATGCQLDSPTYPLYNTNNTGTIDMWDPVIQIPYSDTYTAAWQRQLSRNFAVEARYLGSRSRDQWETLNYNEPNIIENKFLDEFRLAQRNLQVSIASGCGTTANPCTFAYRGPDTGTHPLPIYLAYFSGVRAEFAGEASRYTSSLWTSSNFINPLGAYTANPFTPAGTGDNGLGRDATRQANAIAAGLPANFFHANPNMLGGARAVTNGGFTRYNSLQLMVRRRYANGLQYDVNYTFGNAFDDTRYSFRVPRLLTRATNDVSHALKGTWIFEVPVGRGKRFGTDMNPWLDGLAGGWLFSGTTRIQSGDLFDLGNVRVVGMSIEEAQSLFKMRKVAPDEVYFWPEDVINETIKAWSTSATSPTGYGAMGPPTGRYFAPANSPECLETIANNYGDCGVRTLIVSGPMRFQMDFSLRKNIPFGGKRVFELSIDIFNPFNFVQWSGDTGISNSAFGTTLDGYRPGLPGSQREIQIGTRFTF